MSGPRLKRPPIQVPFDKDGMMEDYRPWQKNVVLKDNFEFDDRLKFVRLIPGRAGTKFMFASLKTCARFYVFQTEMEGFIPLMEKGVLEGRFTFVKRSTSFGIKMV